ncbi:class I SAM-dependent methyltransferase [Lachnoclostridium sp. Marseille-P6806]|uniref:class I SAM-dependent methyltransferase n=1 Tax=Lachnoclostridium sp. Marseille-P6806 TaxID=2364793 RepID=UPI001031C92B|nr:class I SAM-dependent methyltransferase [Lachnoclostridium sp. Marseille-P6806]
MKADYKNWMPKGMILIVAAAAALAAVTGIWVSYVPARIAAGILCIVFSAVLLWMIAMYRAFDYRGKRQMSRQIIEGIAEYVNVPAGGALLDVGCGSGALTIACAKRNPAAVITGLDRWGKDYASFSRELCERNAEAESVTNTRFVQGDAVSLNFPDESFDAVASNYVYHNIPSKNRQELLLEALRILKKGGTFAIHDIFSKSKYGDMDAFVEKLKDMGCSEVRLIPTTDGLFMTHSESRWMGLGGSALLLGRK